MKHTIGWIALYLVGFPAIMIAGLALFVWLGTVLGNTFYAVAFIAVAGYVGYLYGKSEKRSGE